MSRGEQTEHKRLKLFVKNKLFNDLKRLGEVCTEEETSLNLSNGKRARADLTFLVLKLNLNPTSLVKMITVECETLSFLKKTRKKMKEFKGRDLSAIESEAILAIKVPTTFDKVLITSRTNQLIEVDVRTREERWLQRLRTRGFCNNIEEIKELDQFSRRI